MAPQLDGYFKKVDELAGSFVERLREAVAIPSVSSDDKRRDDVRKMAEFLEKELTTLGASVELRELGNQSKKDNLKLPPIVLARYPHDHDPKKKSILVYGHYDVQPADKKDGWKEDPFFLDEKTHPGEMIGRGSTDDKGPVLCWLNAIQAHKEANVEFPVNLLMCFEGMEENGSEGLDDLIKEEAKKYFKDVDAVCISDNYWLGTEKPCLTYGLRGVSYFRVTVKGPAQDLHSGVYGGTVFEPMTDLVKLLGTLVSTNGLILIPGVKDLVRPETPEEDALYDGISFKMSDLYDAMGSETTLSTNVKQTLKARWRYPSLSLHGIGGAVPGDEVKTVIPHKVTGAFSIRTVPDIDSEKLKELVYNHLDFEFLKLGSKNTMDRELVQDGNWWLSSPNHGNFRAGTKATELVWGQKPDMTREGGSIPVTLTFEQETGKNVLLLPVGSSNDKAHSTNEKLDRINYINGTKLLGAYLHYVVEEDLGH